MATPASLEHLIRSKLEPTYSASYDFTTLLTRWWMDATDNDRRKVGDRSYWEALP